MTEVIDIEHTILELAWSLWTELGLPGVHRNHTTCAIDPEPLIVFTPHLAQSDPRLLEQAKLWCARHHRHLSKSRIVGMAKRLQPLQRQHFEEFAQQASDLGVQWLPQRGARDARSTAKRSKPRALPLDRPALARLRIRALAGVGARAEVLCELLAAKQAKRWLNIPDLHGLGFTQPSLFRVVADLEDAQMLEIQKPARSKKFRLSRPAELERFIDSRGLQWNAWAAVFEVASALLELSKDGSGETTRNIKANDARDRLAGFVWHADFPDLPVTVSNPSAWTELLAWGDGHLARVGIRAKPT